MKPISANARHGLLLSPSSGKRAFQLADCCVGMMHLFTVGFVVAILVAVMTVGYFVLLPNLCQSSAILLWSRALAIFLSVNVSLNYVLAAMKKSTAKNAELPKMHGDSVPQGFYDNYRYCVLCQSVKSPGVHHCSTCNACIEDMDHHCPFIRNCVGKKNLHNFLLFLFWTGIGAMYAMFVSIMVIIGAWPLIRDRQKRRPRPHFLPLTLSASTNLPWWVLAAFYMLVVCFSGCMGVFALLASQLHQIQRGQSYIESLKHGKASARPESLFNSLAQAFGGRNPLLWLFPFCFPQRAPYAPAECKTV